MRNEWGNAYEVLYIIQYILSSEQLGLLLKYFHSGFVNVCMLMTRCMKFIYLR